MDEQAARDVERWRLQRDAMADLRRQITETVLARVLPAGATPVLELGAGAGQLRTFTPASLQAGLVHLDIRADYLRALHELEPSASLVRADAHSLPFGAQCFAAGVALCALDVLDDPARALCELRRVLRPGARLVHLLDLATNLEPVLTDAVTTHRLVLPNFLDRAELAREAPKGAAGPDVDLVTLPQRQFVRWVKWLAEAGHPMAGLLASWGQAFLPGHFEAKRTARFFVQTLRDPEPRHRLLTLWRQLVGLHRQAGGEPLSLEPLSSLRHFRNRMTAAFSAGGFEVEFDDVVVSEKSRPRDEDAPANVGFFRDWVGTAVALARPEPDDGVPLPAFLSPAPRAAATATHEQGVVARCGVHVFVVRRAQRSSPGKGPWLLARSPK